MREPPPRIGDSAIRGSSERHEDKEGLGLGSAASAHLLSRCCLIFAPFGATLHIVRRASSPVLLPLPDTIVRVSSLAQSKRRGKGEDTRFTFDRRSEGLRFGSRVCLLKGRLRFVRAGMPGKVSSVPPEKSDY